MRHRHLFACSALLLSGCQPEEGVRAGPGFYGPAPEVIHIRDFGEVEVGEVAILEAPVRAGSQATFLSPPEIAPPFSSDLETIEKLEPGQERVVHFTFRPTEPGSYSQEIQLRTSGATGIYRLRGIGLPGPVACEPAARTDRFPSIRPRVDLLLVTDDHRSMEAVRERVVEAGRMLPGLLDEAGIDWRLAVTTSSTGEGCPGGTLLGEVPILSTGEAVDDLVEAALRTPGCEGGNGFGLEAAVSAVQAAGDAFRRSEAGLALLVFSTRDDKSPGDVPAYGRSLQAGRQAVRTLAVVGEVGGRCSLAEPGTRYGEAVSFLGGMRRSLCDEDWGLAAFFPGSSTFGMPLTFPLAGRPVDGDDDGIVDDRDGELHVRIDGREVASRNESSWRIWDYDPARNAVAFYPRFVPQPGQTVEIDYTEACD